MKNIKKTIWTNEGSGIKWIKAVEEALNSGLYEKAIQSGELTVLKAWEIIDSAGFVAPKEIKEAADKMALEIKMPNEDIKNLHYKFPSYNPPIDLSKYRAPVEFKSKYPFKEDHFIHSEHKYRIPGRITYSDGILEITLKENRKEIEVTINELHPEGYKGVDNIPKRSTNIALEFFDNVTDLNNYLLGIREKFKSSYRTIDEIYEDLKNRGVIKNTDRAMDHELVGKKIKTFILGVNESHINKIISTRVTPENFSKRELIIEIEGGFEENIPFDKIDQFYKGGEINLFDSKGNPYIIELIIQEESKPESFSDCLSRNGINLEKDQHRFEVGTVITDIHNQVFRVKSFNGNDIIVEYYSLLDKANNGHSFPLTYNEIIDFFTKGEISIKGFLPEEKMEFARVLNSIQHCKKMDALLIELERSKNQLKIENAPEGYLQKLANENAENFLKEKPDKILVYVNLAKDNILFKKKSNGFYEGKSWVDNKTYNYSAQTVSEFIRQSGNSR